MNSVFDAYGFYRQYHGHPISSLEALRAHFLSNNIGTIFLAGDSSMDNKHWLIKADLKSDPKLCVNECWVSAPWQMSDMLQPAKAIQDVAYWMNSLATSRIGAINCAVEATTLEERARKLRVQDLFIQDNISPEDVLVVSVGGNDIALKPTSLTVLCMLLMLWTPMWLISAGFAPGLGHFVQNRSTEIHRNPYSATFSKACTGVYDLLSR